MDCPNSHLELDIFTFLHHAFISNCTHVVFYFIQVNLPELVTTAQLTPASSPWLQLWLKVNGQLSRLASFPVHATLSITIGPEPLPNLAEPNAEAARAKYKQSKVNKNSSISSSSSRRRKRRINHGTLKHPLSLLNTCNTK